jgi:hypothetical protein
MKRIVLGLAMLSSLALAAAPAYAVNLECGNSYAIELHGTEPELTADQPLHYIAGIGVIKFGARNVSTNSCVVTSGALIYNDNDVVTFSAGPATCYTGNSLLGGGIPCFDGSDDISGSLTPSVNGNGAADLSILATFNWTNGGPGASVLPLEFTLQQNAGAITVLGNSAADPGPNPTSPPPGSPVLVITMQKQSSTITLPKTGPGNQTGALPPGYLSPTGSPLNALGNTGGGGNGYGVAPYTGSSISLFQGYGAPSADLFSQPIQGSFGTTISVLSIFANGQSGGSVSFNSNDNVGNTTGATNDDCDTGTVQTGNFADGTSNIGAWLLHPSAHCADAVAVATFELSTAVWGAIDTSTFSIVTGLSASTLTSGGLIPAGLMSDATGLSSGISGGLTPIVLTSVTSVNNTATGFIKFINSSAAGCDITASLPGSSGSAGTWSCTQAPLSASFTAEGDTGLTGYSSTSCHCTGTGAPTGGNAVSIGSTLTMTSSNCPLTYSNTITCKN